MEFRDASTADAEAIAAVASASLRESYGHAVDEDRIDALVDRWYDPERVAEELAAGSDWIVAVDDDDVVGVAEVELLEGDAVVGEIDWLHVAPGTRGAGIGRQLLGRVTESVEKSGATVLRGTVLADNEDGVAFYEATGFDRVDEREVTLDDAAFTEYVYETPVDDAEAEAVLETVAGPDGDLVVNFSEGESGTEAPFYPAYRSRDMAERYGWYCSNCESVDTSMDPSGRVACNECGNTRPATNWDDSYL